VAMLIFFSRGLEGCTKVYGEDSAFVSECQQPWMFDAFKEYAAEANVIRNLQGEAFLWTCNYHPDVCKISLADKMKLS